MLNPGLPLLIRLQTRARLRRGWRTLRSVRGAFFLLIALFVLALWLGPSYFADRLAHPTDPRQVRALMPLLLLGAVLTTLLTTASDKAIAFSPAEVDFLFAAPVSRRQLLGYKLLKSAGANLLIALPLALALRRHGAWWAGIYLSIFLSLVLLQLLNMAALFLAQTVGRRRYSLARILALGTIGALVVWAFVLTLAGPGAGATDLADRFVHCLPGRIVLAPFAPFALVMTAGSSAQLLGGAAPALGVLALLLVLIFRLDADYLEAAVVASQRALDRQQRARRGGFTAVSAGSGRRRLPMLPRLGGAGPIAWRQCLTALRSARGLLLALLVLVAGLIPSILVLRGRGAGEPGQMLGILVGAIAWGTIFLSGTLRMDYRGDLEQLPWLKQLPIGPMRLTIGQLAVPVAILSACQMSALGMLALAVPGAARLALPAIAAAVPFNLVVIGVENLAFLLYPTRAFNSPGDIQGFGRQIALLFLKVLCIGLVLGAAALAGVIASAVTGSWAVTVIVALLILCAGAAALVALVAWAFVRFDVSAHMPG